MIPWYVFALLSAIFGTAFALLVRSLLKDKGDYLAFTFITDIVAFVTLLILTLFEKTEYSISLPIIIIAIIVNIVYAAVDIISNRGRQLEEVSNVSLVSQVGAIWTLFGAALILGEPITPAKACGVTLILFGNLIVLYEGRKITLSKGIQLIIIATVLGATAPFGDKYLIQFFSPALYKALSFFLTSFCILTYLKWDFKRVGKEIKLQGWQVALPGICMAVSLYLFISGLKVGEVSRVIPVESLNLIFSVIFGIILLNEKGKTYQKIIAAGIIFLGAYLLTI